MPQKRKAQSPQQWDEVEKKSKVASRKRRTDSGGSSRSDTSSRSSNHNDSDASNDSFCSVSDYYQPDKRGRFDKNLLDTVDSAESSLEYKFYRETPAKRKLDKLSRKKDAKECIGKLTSKYDCLREENEHTIILNDDAGFRMDYQRSYSVTNCDGKKFAVLAVQQKSNMYASAHIETDIKFGHDNVQKALTHSLQETNKADADPKGHRVRLIRVEKANESLIKSPNKPLFTVEEENHSECSAGK